MSDQVLAAIITAIGGITIGELAVEREKRRRELFGYEQGGSWMAARDARRQLASVDAELNALIDSVIAEETAALAAK